MSRAAKILAVALFATFAALPAHALYYEGPGSDWTVRGFGLREWVSMRQSKIVSVRTEFCAGSFHYTVQGPIDRWAFISVAVLIGVPTVLFFGFRMMRGQR